MDVRSLNSWLEISEHGYRHNLIFFRRLLNPRTEFSVVVKANAYGHGLREIAELATKIGVDSFCVHSLDEALQIRQFGIEQDVLILGHVPERRLAEAVDANFRLALLMRETLTALIRETRKLNTSVRVHLKLETGTNRQGIDEQDLPEILEMIRKAPSIIPEACYTHFANIEDTTDHNFAYGQIKKFREMSQLIREAGFSQVKLHSACSAAVLLFPETYFDMVRLGISQYGLWPSRETFVSYKIKHAPNGENVLRPVLSWKTRIGQIKEVQANRCIGYGCSFQTTRNSRIAVLPVGYSDGYDRKLSNQGYVLVKGRRAPIRGRICMNMFMVDVTDIPGVELEEEVVLMGQQGEEEITADYLAGLAGTINYEWISRINPRLPRIVV